MKGESIMSHRFPFLFIAVPVIVLGASLSSFAQDLAPIKLPDPVMSGGKPLMDVLKARATARELSPEKIPAQILASLLWAGWGINRPDGRRTAPSAGNGQEIDIYVVLPEAAYLWDAKTNVLNPVAAGDHRSETGSQPYVQNAQLNLIYVADKKKANRQSTDPQQIVNIGADTGFISENVYLFCTSEGLSTVVRAGFARESLAKTLNLRESQLIVLAQTVGFPKK
jgi:nitroreductase